MTPEAVFEIVGAGSEIPNGFVQPGPGGLILESPWIGVAICAVISVHHVDAYMVSKYTVTTHINLGEKHWKIPIPVNFLVAESETQLVFYWTKADDLQRIVGSSQKSNFSVSFSVEPKDSNLHVAKSGIRFIHDKYMLRHPDSIIRVGIGMKCFVTLSLKEQKHIINNGNCTYIGNHFQKIVDRVFDQERHGVPLDDIKQVTKAVLEINLKLIECLKDRPMDVYSYYPISLGVLALYNDFVKSLKDINDRWLSVKLALEQIVVKIRADRYSVSYKEMLLQLNDLEAAKSVVFSDRFITLLTSIFMRTFDIIIYFGAGSSDHSLESYKSWFCGLDEKVLIIIISVWCTVAVYMDDSKLQEAIKETEMISMLQHLLHAFTDKKHMKDGMFTMKRRSNGEFPISEFYDNGHLLQDLINKMNWSNCFTTENEEEMMSVIDKLEKNIDKVSCIIQDIRSHADQYSHDIGKAKKYVKSFSQLSKDDDIISILPLFKKI